MSEPTGRVTGIGGVFFRSPDPEATIEWYRAHLGIEREADFPCAVLRSSGGETAVWAPFADDTPYFGAADQQFMLNFRVDDLAALLARLRADGIEVDDEVARLDNGDFGWIVDCDGRRIELWQPTPGE